MRNKKCTKSAFVISILSLVLCLSMLVGTTFAWFTKSVTSGNNRILAGNLELSLYEYKSTNEGTETWVDISNQTDPIFQSILGPNDIDVHYLKIENTGNLALQWQANLVTNATELSELADVIEVYVTTEESDMPQETKIVDVDDAAEFEMIQVEWTLAGSLSDFIADFSTATKGVLYPESVAYLGIALHMQSDVSSEYQNMDLGGTFDIQILATQYADESDSFGTEYDDNAKYDINNVYIGNEKYDSISAAIKAAKDGDTIRLTAGTFYEALDLQGKSLTIQGAGKNQTIIAGPQEYATNNIPKQTWNGWANGNNQDDANVYALISANKDVTIKDLTVSANPEQIAKVPEFRHQADSAFVGIHIQSANATIENVDIKNIKPATVNGTDHHNFGLYITSAQNDNNNYKVTYQNGIVSDVNRGGIYCWSDKYTLNFEKVTVVGPGSPTNPNGTLTPAETESHNAIYAFAPFYLCTSDVTYSNVVIYDSWCVDNWGGASWNWASEKWADNPPEGVTCINSGKVQ